MSPQYRNQLVNAAYRENRCWLPESCVTHRYILWAKCLDTHVQEGGKYKFMVCMSVHHHTFK